MMKGDGSSKNKIKYGAIEENGDGMLNTSIETNGETDNVPMFNGECTVFETSSNLLTIITGSGLLSLPYAAAVTGWSTVILLLLLGCIFIYTLHLVAETIEHVHYLHQVRASAYGSLTERDRHMLVDYTFLGKEVFGSNGDKYILLVFGTEMTLALVSFLMNIGININTINPNISYVEGIFIATIISIFLSFADLKLAAYSSIIGLVMTLLTVGAILLSGLELDHVETAQPEKTYNLFLSNGIPISVGLISFCFGGHGTFPKMYFAMKDRSRYKEVLFYTAIVLAITYGFVMVTGYYFYAQYSLTPITLNIGRDLYFRDMGFGSTLKIAACVGVIFNLQVTCPLATFPVRDMLLQMFKMDFNHFNLRTVGIAVIFLASMLALLLKDHFAAVCGLIGSVATTTNSIIFPIIFYHYVLSSKIPIITSLFHLVILLLILASAVTGIYYDIWDILKG